MQHEFAFEKLDVWQKARLFVKEIYGMTKMFPAEERYAITQQIQRASVSITSNIAEGTSRFSAKEQCRFTEIAYGSLMEVYCQIITSKDLNYIDDNQFETIKVLIIELSNKLNALRNSQLKRVNN